MKIKTVVAYSAIFALLLIVGTYVPWLFSPVRFEKIPAVELYDVSAVSETPGRYGWRKITVRNAEGALSISGYRVSISCSNDPSVSTWRAELYNGARAPTLWWSDKPGAFRLIILRTPSGAVCPVGKKK